MGADLTTPGGGQFAQDLTRRLAGRHLVSDQVRRAHSVGVAHGLQTRERESVLHGQPSPARQGPLIVGFGVDAHHEERLSAHARSKSPSPM